MARSPFRTRWTAVGVRIWVTYMQVGHVEQSQQTIRRAAEILRSGGLVVFPTETVYGIAASAASDKGIEALRAFKGRPVNEPLTVHLPDPHQAHRYLGTPHPIVQRLIRKTFPGPVTLVVDVDPELLGHATHTYQRLYHRNTIGLRCPDLPIAREILGAIDAPIVASSANARGARPPYDATEAVLAVGQAADLVVDGGRCRFAKPSTIVRIRFIEGRPSVQIDRVGVYDERFIRKLISWTLVVVCSGNTCRSPMAQAIAKQVLAEKLAVAVDYLPQLGIQVESAGVFASDGIPASAEACDEMASRGIDLSHHQSKRLNANLIQRADLCCCMTKMHHRAAVEMAPDAADKIVALDDNGDIEDPIGLGSAAYHRCAELIRVHLIERLKEYYP